MLVATRQYDKAIEQSKGLIEMLPYDPTNYVELAEIYAFMGRDSLALQSYSDAFRLDSTNFATLGSMSDFYSYKRDWKGYLDIENRLYRCDELQLEEKVARFERLTSERSFYGANFFQIDAIASTLYTLAPTNEKVLNLYANHMMASGNMEEALRLYKARLNDDPPVLSYFNSILDIEQYNKRADSVEKYMLLAIERFPKSVELYNRRGGMLQYVEQNKEALQAFRLALKYSDTDSLKSATYGFIGDVYHAMNQDKKSFAAYEKALKLDSLNILVLNNYAYFLSLRGEQLDRAERMAATACKLSGTNPTYSDTHAWVLYMKGEYEQAKKIMQQAISLDRTNSTELMIHYGDIYLALGDEFMAKLYWKKALDNGHDKSEIDDRMNRLEQR